MKEIFLLLLMTLTNSFHDFIERLETKMHKSGQANNENLKKLRLLEEAIKKSEDGTND